MSLGPNSRDGGGRLRKGRASVRSVQDELDRWRCEGLLPALGDVPQVPAEVASKVRRGSGPRQQRRLRRSTGGAPRRRRASDGIAPVLFDATNWGVTHGSLRSAFEGGAARQTRRRRAVTQRKVRCGTLPQSRAELSAILHFSVFVLKRPVRQSARVNTLAVRCAHGRASARSRPASTRHIRSK
jgi:hypothetical protein